MAAKKPETTLPPGRLWPDTPWGSPVEIEVFGATGEFATGKTLLGLSIAPGVHPAGHPFEGQPRTLYLDLEKSGATYGGIGCQRVDVPAELSKTYGSAYTDKQAAEWFVALPGKLKPGRFDNVIVDPVNDLEMGITELVRTNPGAHGYTANQFSKSTPLLMAAMKAYWKKLLLQWSTVCKCFYFTTHLRDQFKGGQPTNKREPRGRVTLAELASLYLWLERKPDDKGIVPDKPSAIVLKQRLADTRVNEAGELEIVNLMPPRIPTATVQEIRAYISNPPDYKRLKVGEKVIEEQPTEMELEQVRLATAQARTEAAVAQTALLDRQQELMAIRNREAADKPQQPDQTATARQDAEEKRDQEQLAARLKQQQEEGQRLNAAAPPENLAAHRPSVNGRVERFKELLPASGIEPAKIKAAIEQHGATRFTELSEQLQDGLLSALQKAADARQQQPATEPAKN